MTGPSQSSNDAAHNNNEKLAADASQANYDSGFECLGMPSNASNTSIDIPGSILFSGSTLSDQASKSASGDELVNRYLALCINTGRCHMTLGEINVTSLLRDNEVFRMIKQRYFEIRGFRAQARRLFLVRPSSIHFVKVRINIPNEFLPYLTMKRSM